MKSYIRYLPTEEPYKNVVRPQSHRKTAPAVIANGAAHLEEVSHERLLAFNADVIKTAEDAIKTYAIIWSDLKICIHLSWRISRARV